MVVSEDGGEAIVGYYRERQPSNGPLTRLHLAGLLPDGCYRISGRDYTCYGDELMNAGLILSDQASGVLGEAMEIQGDYQSRIFELTLA